MIASSTSISATTATKTTSTTTSTTMPTPKSTVNINEDDLDNLLENVSDIKLWIIIIATIIVKIVIIKLIKLCKRGYTMHNEKIIQRHNRITPQL